MHIISFIDIFICTIEWEPHNTKIPNFWGKAWFAKVEGGGEHVSWKYIHQFYLYFNCCQHSHKSEVFKFGCITNEQQKNRVDYFFYSKNLIEIRSLKVDKSNIKKLSMTSSDEIPKGAHLNLTEFNPYYNQQCRPMNLSQQRGVDWDSYVKNQPLFEVFRKKIRAFSSQKTINVYNYFIGKLKFYLTAGSANINFAYRTSRAQ